MTQFHGQLHRMTTVNAPHSSHFAEGRFGRLFPTLPPFALDRPDVRDRLKRLGTTTSQGGTGLMDGGEFPQDHPSGLAAGFTFLGQFIDHDVTFDPTSDIEAQNDPEAIRNFRTPLLELDSMYGSGPGATPHLYDARSSRGEQKMLIDDGWEDDLPRNSQNRALIGDPRNDENSIIGQMHLLFLKFHNAVIEHLRNQPRTHENTLFAEAQRVVRWHYQWIVLKEFLPAIVGEDLVRDVLTAGRRFYNWRNDPFIPVEFSVAAYRFGHTMVRHRYQLNPGFAVPIFAPGAGGSDPDDPDDLRGGVRPRDRETFRRFVEWDRFFTISGGTQPQLSGRFDTLLPTALFDLQGLEEDSLAARNLQRGLAFGLPAGQDVARAMEVDPLTPEELKELKDLGFHTRTPLWYYILREAEVRNGGATLGPVGGRIVAEVLIGVLQGDRQSFLRRDPKWVPRELGLDGDFTMADLVKFAGGRISCEASGQNA